MMRSMKSPGASRPSPPNPDPKLFCLTAMAARWASCRAPAWTAVFFHRLGASRLDRTICSAAGGVGLVESTGFKYGTEPEQFRHSRLILAWGANILGTNVHLWPFIVEARRQGARLYTID